MTAGGRRRAALRMLPALAALAILLCTVQSAPGETVAQEASEKARFRLVTVAEGLERPWAVAFLPDSRILVTERTGRLRLVDREGRPSAPIANVPAVLARGQGGLLDVAISPTFEQDRTVFLSFAEPTAQGGRTAVARARLEGGRLQDVAVIFRQRQDPSGGNHWGSRLVFAKDGTLFVTLGDRYSYRDQAQQLHSHLGKIVRIRADGSVPDDNPFAGTANALPEIWSYGHRNVQGATLDPATGRLWTSEHGARGGDEINIARAGRNYGWPVITHGVDYSGAPIGVGSARAGMEQPAWQWTPSIAPSGLAFYTGDRFPAWRGNLFAGALKDRMLVRLELDGDRVIREERLLAGLGERIRDVRQGPDGLIYLLTDEAGGRLLRLEPADQ